MPTRFLWAFSGAVNNACLQWKLDRSIGLTSVIATDQEVMQRTRHSCYPLLCVMCDTLKKDMNPIMQILISVGVSSCPWILKYRRNLNSRWLSTIAVPDQLTMHERSEAICSALCLDRTKLLVRSTTFLTVTQRYSPS